MAEHMKKISFSLKPFFQDNVNGISKMQWMRYQAGVPYKLFFKSNLNADMLFEFIDMKPRRKGRINTNISFLSIMADAPPITNQIKKKKYDDLISFLPYIPPTHHEFYKKLDFVTRKTEIIEEPYQDRILDSDSE